MRHVLRLALLGAASTLTLVATGSNQQPARWTLEATPIVTLGLDDRDPAALFQQIVSATRLPDGSILVGDRGDFALKEFAPSGALRRSFARKGAGPGEVRLLGSMYRCGDSVYANDAGEGFRMSVFTLDGRYVRAFRFRVPPGQQVPYLSACNATGHFVHLGWGARNEMRAGLHRSVVPVWISRGDSSEPRMTDSVPGSERWGMARDGRIVGSRPLPLGKQPVVGIGRSRVYVGSADRFHVRAFDLSGRSTGALERALMPVAASRADIRDEIERVVSAAGEARRARVEAEYAEIALPATLPAYTHLVVDADDHAWIRAHPNRAAETVSWSVFSPAGTLVAEASVPQALEVFEIGRDYVLGKYLDPVEAIPQVRLYRLTRTPTRGR